MRTEWWAVWELITWGKDWAEGPAVAELPGCIEGVFGGSDGKESAYNAGDLV